MQRRSLLILIGLLLVAVLLDASGLVPGAGMLAVPLLILLSAALLVGRALRPSAEAQAEQAIHIPRGTAQAARLELLVGAADLALGSGGDGEDLLGGVCRGAIRHQVDAQADEPAIKFNQPFSLLGRAHADWRLDLANVAWRAIKIEMVSSHARLALVDLNVENLVLEMAGGTLFANLAAGEASLQISGGRAVFHIPERVPTEIVSEIRLGEVKVDESRFTPAPEGDRWTSSGYAEAAQNSPSAVLRLTLKGGLGSVEVNGDPFSPQG